jgi:hypothetical protein
MAELKQAAVYFGICPSGGPPCGRSYELGMHIPDDRMAWYSRTHFPGAGEPGPRDSALRALCDKVYQVQSEERGYCTECGLALVFNPKLPDLGKCHCGRKYAQADFNIGFCPKCGEPVSIDEKLKTEHAKQSRITKLLEEVPRLQSDGYLPSRVGLNT